MGKSQQLHCVKSAKYGPEKTPYLDTFHTFRRESTYKKGILREYSKKNSCDKVLFNEGSAHPATLNKNTPLQVFSYENLFLNLFPNSHLETTLTCFVFLKRDLLCHAGTEYISILRSYRGSWSF